MAVGVSLQLPPYELGVLRNYGGHNNQFKRQGVWSLHFTYRISKPLQYPPCRYNLFTCRCLIRPSFSDGIPLLKNTTLAISRLYNVLMESSLMSGSFTALKESPLVMRLVTAIGIVAFAVWGLGPLMRYSRNLFFCRNDNNWKKSRTHYVFTSYLQPLLLWTGATLACRAFDKVVLPSTASQTVKQRLLHFVQSLSTVLAFAYCLTSLIQQAQKFFMEKNSSDDTRNMGFQFAVRAVYTALWVAAFSLFMELLGFSTQKWVTAGGLGTVLLTLAGREIFTNFLSSIMIHATQPFVLNEWIQAKIEGYEVSGTVEHVGWWSPTIIRGDDREAIHIPNHKFTVNVVRNLSQKTHWRIKTHFAISHLDVNKISNVVADMRKVLAKNPQIEQQRLHRRVFLDNINPENQALLILISCFVKTSHFEEYSCVKEAVMLDLLRVISHHRARLATPIRTVQKVYTDADMDNIPFSETIYNPGGTALNRPLLLIDLPQRINGEGKAKPRTATPRSNEEQTINTVAPEPPRLNEEQTKNTSSPEPPRIDEEQTKNTAASEPRPDMVNEGVTENNTEKQQEKKHQSKQVDVAAAAAVKNESKKPASSSAASRPVFEDNIVLGVALEGSKRTLPIKEEIETSEMTASRSGNNGSSPSNVKERKGQMPPQVAGK